MKKTASLDRRPLVGKKEGNLMKMIARTPLLFCSKALPKVKHRNKNKKYAYSDELHMGPMEELSS